MEKFAVIIPDRNDRPEFTKFCLHQVERMGVSKNQLFHVNYKPIDHKMDLVERVHFGTMAAKTEGYDICFVVENDDWYPIDYFDRFGDMVADFFGDDMTFYYNLKQRAFSHFEHPGRSSLFTTGFRISALEQFNFQWGGTDPFIDMRIWKYAKERKFRTRYVNAGTTGIKHGRGLCGGKGHTMRMQNQDPDMKWLKDRVDGFAFEFYQKVSNELQEVL